MRSRAAFKRTATLDIRSVPTATSRHHGSFFAKGTDLRELDRSFLHTHFTPTYVALPCPTFTLSHMERSGILRITSMMAGRS